MFTKHKLCRRCTKQFSPQRLKDHYCSLHCRFLEYVHIPVIHGCWTWIGSRHGKGYGHFRLNGKIEKAHRVSWLIFKGELPKLMVLHKCDNPACVNPSHLFLGTNDDNLKDRQAKGRQARGENHSRARLNAFQVLAIREDKRHPDEIAKDYSMNEASIRSIQKRRSWKHLED